MRIIVLSALLAIGLLLSCAVSYSALSVQWLGQPCLVEADPNGYVPPGAPICLASPPVELGLRADGVVVWRALPNQTLSGE